MEKQYSQELQQLRETAQEKHSKVGERGGEEGSKPDWNSSVAQGRPTLLLEIESQGVCFSFSVTSLNQSPS